MVAVAVSQRISQKENQSKLSRLFVKTNPTPESVAIFFYFILCLFPFNFEYWKYPEYWKCNKVFKSSNILQECQYSHYWKNNLCDFSHLKMSRNFTWKMHSENTSTMANFSDFFLKIIAYLASHCRTKPHYFPTKATMGKIETRKWRNSFYNNKAQCLRDVSPCCFNKVQTWKRPSNRKLASNFGAQLEKNGEIFNLLSLSQVCWVCNLCVTLIEESGILR